MARCSYLKSVAAVFFAAVCAYLGAWLFPSLSQGPHTAPVTAAAEIHLGLEGIALRRETALMASDNPVFLPGDAQRIPAGALLWQNAEGEDLLFDKSAIFMAGCDGFEQLSPPENEKLGMAELSEFLNAAPSEQRGRARLVEGFYWYYAAYAPADCPKLSTGSHYLKFQGFDKYTKALLVSCETGADGTALLFRLNLGDSAYLKLRKCRAELLLPSSLTA